MHSEYQSGEYESVSSKAKENKLHSQLELRYRMRRVFMVTRLTKCHLYHGFIHQTIAGIISINMGKN